MKTLRYFVPLLALALVSLRAADLPGKSTVADDRLIAAVTAADAERQAASEAGDRGRLEAIFSNDLRYAHASGKVDTKASYIESMASHGTVYENFNYKERTFLPAAPGIVLMTGRVLITVRNGDQHTVNDLNFLAVWREENGQWRFLAWQSCRNPPPPPARVARG
jgi:hypothetical protein